MIDARFTKAWENHSGTTWSDDQARGLHLAYRDFKAGWDAHENKRRLTDAEFDRLKLHLAEAQAEMDRLDRIYFEQTGRHWVRN